MLISDGMARAISNVAAREKQTLGAFAPPETYFAVKGDDGMIEYTREQEFHWSNGRLTDAAGQAVLGRRSAESPLEPLAVDPVDAALNLARSPEIESDGGVTYERSMFDPRTARPITERVFAGRIAVARFPAATQLRWRDQQHAVAPDGIAPHVTDASLDQLQHAYLSLDALRAADVVRSHAQKTAMDLLK
ncbi:MAG TPA: hypothetical protein VFE17_01715 [Candidatus Baltobacteraceae bacterium]|jgi:hypothetical protein|nr:hypothetical protein [Candidatus Baltobacteraceae bacterium]